MRIVRGALLDRPLFHLMGNNIRRHQIKLFPFLDRSLQILVNLLRQTLLHYRIIKYVFSKNSGYIQQFTHSSYAPFPYFSLQTRSKLIPIEKGIPTFVGTPSFFVHLLVYLNPSKKASKILTYLRFSN